MDAWIAAHPVRVWKAWLICASCDRWVFTNGEGWHERRTT